LEKNELFVLSNVETDPKGTVLSDARPLHPKENVIPTLRFEGSHPIQAVGEDPRANSGAVIFSSMAAH
jgi:hypothetical protein